MVKNVWKEIVSMKFKKLEINMEFIETIDINRT